MFNNTEEWWQAIPEEVRPRKDQPFYHLLAENAQTEYIAYVSEQNLLPDSSGHAAAPSAGARDVRARRRRQLPAAVPAAAALRRGDVCSNGKRPPCPGSRSTTGMRSARAVISLPAGLLPAELRRRH